MVQKSNLWVYFDPADTNMNKTKDAMISVSYDNYSSLALRFELWHTSGTLCTS